MQHLYSQLLNPPADIIHSGEAMAVKETTMVKTQGKVVLSSFQLLQPSTLCPPHHLSNVSSKRRVHPLRIHDIVRPMQSLLTA
jgi:hypothetical protein